MTKLYLTRHGETEWNEKGIMQGWGDSPLTELGIKQAEWLRDRIKEIEIFLYLLTMDLKKLE